MRVRGPVVAAGVAAALLTACGGAPATSAGAPAKAPVKASASPGRVRADDFKSVRTIKQVPLPLRVRIPSINLVTPPLVSLGRVKKGDGSGLPVNSISLPSDPLDAGWFDGGPRPGAPGPAVIVGHVDMAKAAAVFFNLRDVSPGDLVYVDRVDGSTETFKVTQRREVAKVDFPTEDVYAPDLDPSLRLITCGGQFDHEAHSYLDNIIVFASPV